MTRICETPVSAAQPREQVQDLILDRHVERGRRLVAEQQLRLGGERDCDHDALAQAARELVRVGPVAALGVGDADQANQLERALPGLCSARPSRTRGPSAICSPTRMTGLSAVIGSWKTMPMCGAAQPGERFWARAPGRRTRSRRRRSAHGREAGPMIARSVMLLPQPDSPTRPSAPPRGTSRLTPSTALTTPRGVGISTRRSRTERIGSPTVTRAPASPPARRRAARGRIP